MNKFEKLLNESVFYDESNPAGGDGGSGGTDPQPSPTDELEKLKQEFETLKASSTKEINSLKSQLGHANKTIDDYKKNGKSAEEIANMEIEKLQNQNKELVAKINLGTLSSRKHELINELKISSEFADLIVYDSDTTIENLEKQVKLVAEKQKAFETNLLKKHSITDSKFNGGTGKNDNKSSVDRILEKNKNKNKVDIFKL